MRAPVRVKVCGITRPQDALWAARCGADAIGLVFAKSPRRVSVGEARRIAAAAGPFVTAVGVFADQAPAQVAAAARRAALSTVQLHGDEPASESRRLMREFRVIKAFQVGPGFRPSQAADYPCDALLFDTRAEGPVKGGTGTTFDWKLLAHARFGKPVILSGGLGPDNVVSAVRMLSPYAVDASSRLEKTPGIKDPQRVQEFVRNAKKI